MAKNIIIGQSGGPTAVINSSLAGVYKAARSLGADKVYGMKYGIEGLLKEELLELNVLLDDRMSIELLKRTPSSYLGSCRYKLPDPDVDSTPFIKLFTLFDKYDICAVFYIGGNDGTQQALELIKEGTIYRGSVDLNPVGTGELMIQYAVSLCNGESIPESYMVPVTAVTRDNVDEYLAMYK